MKLLLVRLLAGVAFSSICLAADAPSGFMPLSKLAEAQAKAKQSKKLIAITAHGSDDQCPYTADAFAKGTAALRGSCVMVYTRVADLRAQKESLPESLKVPEQTAAEGASVSFYVYDPDMGKIIAQVNRGDIQKDPKSLIAVKKKISEAQKGLAGSPSTSSPSGASGLDSLDAFHKPAF